MTYINYATQEDRILQLLRQRGQKGIFVWEFMLPRNKGGLGIAQYNARIYDLRGKGFIIDNKEKGHFVLVEKKFSKPKSDWRFDKKRKQLKELEEEGQGTLV